MSEFKPAKTLQQRFYELCYKDIKGDFPCDSCYGCKNQIKVVEAWVRELRHDANNAEFDVFTKILQTFSVNQSEKAKT